MTGKVKPQVKVEPKAEPQLKVEPKPEPNTLPLVRSASAAPIMKVQPMMKVEPQIKTEPQTLPLYGSVYIKPKDFNIPDKPKNPTPYPNTSNISNVSFNTSGSGINTSGSSIKTSGSSFNTSGSSINTSRSSINTSGSSFNTSGSSINISGSSINTSTSSFNTSGLETSSYMPQCNCFPDPSQEIDSGPYYTHLGIASSLVQLRQIMEDRCQVKGKALRIEKAKYCRREGKSSLGCPIGELPQNLKLKYFEDPNFVIFVFLFSAKYIIRRMSLEEKYLVVTRERTGHQCQYQWMVLSIIAWEGVPSNIADFAYNHISDTIAKHGKSFSRQCEFNQKKTCACQGKFIISVANFFNS